VPYRPIPSMFGVDNERCGVSSSSGINARVLSGRKPSSQLEAETNFAEFPWHVAVVNGETGDYLCAGTIISARFVMTVAHCVRKFQLTLLFVRVGDWDLSGVGEMFPSYDVEVQNVIVHEEFYAGNLQNDIALLQLKFPLDFSVMPHVGTICLAPSSEPIYSDCIVTGWGQQLSTSEAKGDAATFSRTLKQTSQTLVTSQFCEKALRPYLGQFYQLPKKGFVCAYDKDGKDSCFGDGGGALACLVNAPNYPKPMQYHVVGLVSWGVGCGMPNVPSAYTAIWDYLDWIRSKINPIDAYPMANPQPLKEPSPNILLRSNEASSTTAPTPLSTAAPTKLRDFIDLAFT
jgi:secreted trypsin-like serine protease